MSTLTGITLNNRFVIHEWAGTEDWISDVYSAWDNYQKIVVAIKVIHDPRYMSYIINGLALLRQLQHPNLLRILDVVYDKDKGLYFIITNWTNSKSLRKLISNKQKFFTPSEILPILQPVCSVLGFIHQRGVIHNDIKPGNILVDMDGKVVLSGYNFHSRQLKRTDSGGSLAYMAPELFASKEPNIASDIYSLGITVFEMLSMQLPFYGDTRERLIWEKSNTPLPVLNEINPNISQNVSMIVEKALSVKPDKRYSSVEEFWLALEHAVIAAQKSEVYETTFTEKRKSVFICYSKEDIATVRKLYEDLTAIGIFSWIDVEDLLPGQDWELEIRNAIFESDYFLACLSKNSIDKKGYVQKEIKIALDVLDRMPEGKVYLIPVRLEECKVPPSLEKYQWVDLFAHSGFEKLSKVL